MKSWQTDLIAVVCIVLGLLPWVMDGGLPDVIGPSEGPRAVVTVTESGTATPARDALLAELRTNTDWGKSIYRAYESDHAAAKDYPGDGLHIYQLTGDGKRTGEPLFSGELPKTKDEVIAKWREVGGE